MKKSAALILFAVMAFLSFAGCAKPVSTASPSPTEQPSVSASEAPASVTPSASASPSETATPKASSDIQEAPASGEGLATITKQSITYDNEYIKVNAEYPVLSLLSDSAQQKSLNSSIYDALKSKIDETESDSKSQDQIQQFQFTADYKIYRNDGKYVSLRLDIEEWTGGADDNLYSQCYTYMNTNPGSILSFDSLFTDDSDYLNTLDDMINEKITAQPNAADYFFSGIGEETGFCITDTDLVVIFNEYDIAAATEGEPEFKIPFSSLSEILVPELK